MCNSVRWAHNELIYSAIALWSGDSLLNWSSNYSQSLRLGISSDSTAEPCNAMSIWKTCSELKVAWNAFDLFRWKMFYTFASWNYLYKSSGFSFGVQLTQVRCTRVVRGKIQLRFKSRAVTMFFRLYLLIAIVSLIFFKPISFIVGLYWQKKKLAKYVEHLPSPKQYPLVGIGNRFFWKNNEGNVQERTNRIDASKSWQIYAEESRVSRVDRRKNGIGV